MKKLKYKKVKKYRYIPSIITYFGCFLGILSILFSFKKGVNNLKLGGILILIAGFMDKLDGYLARKLDVVSNFGRELDSLCDLISFGIAPIILWLNIDSNLLYGINFLPGVIYIFTGVYRLARFNIMLGYEEYIIGLPITIAGMIFSLKVCIDINYRIFKNINMTKENIILSLVLSLSMISDYKIKKPKIKV